MTDTNKPQPKLVETTPDEEPVSVKKPATGGLERFRSKRSPAIAGVQTLLTALPIFKIGDVKDYVRLHPNEDKYWSPEFCFVTVPIIGQKDDLLHLIDEELAMKYLSNRRVERFRLALATKPHDVFFLCRVPSQNLDNAWNAQALDACAKAKEKWAIVVSRKAEGIEGYKTEFSEDQDAFPEPNWPEKSLEQLVEATFEDRMIDRHDHPALLRLRGKKQSLK